MVFDLVYRPPQTGGRIFTLTCKSHFVTNNRITKFTFITMTKRIFVAIAVCVFFASFFQPAFTNDGSDQAADPIAIFLTGWMGIFAGSLACIAWLANPLFFIAVILFLRNRKAALAHDIIKDEAGNYAKITKYDAGYWLWLGSIGMLLVVTLIWSPLRAPLKSEPISNQ